MPHRLDKRTSVSEDARYRRGVDCDVHIGWRGEQILLSLLFKAEVQRGQYLFEVDMGCYSKTHGSNGTRESIQKKPFFFILLVLMSHFFCDELLIPILHFISVDRKERELGGKRNVT